MLPLNKSKILTYLCARNCVRELQRGDRFQVIVHDVQLAGHLDQGLEAPHLGGGLGDQVLHQAPLGDSGGHQGQGRLYLSHHLRLTQTGEQAS